MMSLQGGILVSFVLYLLLPEQLPLVSSIFSLKDYTLGFINCNFRLYLNTHYTMLFEEFGMANFKTVIQFLKPDLLSFSGRTA